MSFLKFLKREKKKEGLDELDLPPAPPPLEGFDEDMSMPEIPDIGGKQAGKMPEAEENQASIEQPAMLPREKTLFPHEKKAALVPMGNSLYVKVERFKIALGSINVVRNDLRKSEEALMKLENIKSMEEKSMSKIRSSLDDLQKKLVFVDKTLFEGE